MPLDASQVKWDEPSKGIDASQVQWDEPSQSKPNPTEGNSFIQNTAIGLGKAVVDTGRGVRQIVMPGSSVQAPSDESLMMYVDKSLPPEQQQQKLTELRQEWEQKNAALQSEVDESRRLDAPLMKTVGGKVGNIGGKVLISAPAMAVPGANTIIGSTITSGLLGALEPTATGESRADNIKSSAITGGVTQAMFRGLGAGLKMRRAGKEAKLAAQEAQDQTKNAILGEAKDAGYVVPPTQANPSLLNKILEGVSGKIQTGQKASEKNQAVTNGLVKKALGIADDAPITPETLSRIRENAGDAYQAIKDIGTPLKATNQYKNTLNKIGNEWSAAAKEFPELANNSEIKNLVSSLNKSEISPEAAVEIIKKLRYDASANLKNFGDPAKTALGFAQKKAATAMEDLIEGNLSSTGNAGLVKQFREARQLIAKSHDVEDALNEVTGNVSARYLARLLDKGTPLSGELKTAARFAKAFPKAAQEVEKIGSIPGFSPLDLAVGGLAAAGSQDPTYLALIAGRPLARSILLSKPYQSVAANAQSYQPGRMLRLSESAANSDMLRRGASVAVPAYSLSDK